MVASPHQPPPPHLPLLSSFFNVYMHREFASEELVQEVECWSCRHKQQLGAARAAAARLERWVGGQAGCLVMYVGCDGQSPLPYSPRSPLSFHTCTPTPNSSIRNADEANLDGSMDPVLAAFRCVKTQYSHSHTYKMTYINIKKPRVLST